MAGEIKENQIQTRIHRALKELEELVNQGFVSRQDLLGIFEKTKIVRHPGVSVLTFQQVFYFIGALLVILGFGYFVFLVWGSWTRIIRVIFSLGLAAFLYGAGYYLHSRYPKLAIFSAVSFILSAFLFPLGIGTFLDFIHIPAARSGGLVINSALLFIIYFGSYSALKNDIFLLFSIAAGSGFFLSLVNLFVPNPSETFISHLVLILGLSYLALGYYYRLSKKYISNLLFLFGFPMFLGSAFTLSFKSIFWLVVFPLLLAGTFYISVLWQSKLILGIGTLLTFIEIGRLTAEYFSETLGWPIALILAGLSIILVGYFSFEVSKRYLKPTSRLNSES